MLCYSPILCRYSSLSFTRRKSTSLWMTPFSDISICTCPKWRHITRLKFPNIQMIYCHYWQNYWCKLGMCLSDWDTVVSNICHKYNIVWPPVLKVLYTLYPGRASIKYHLCFSGKLSAMLQLMCTNPPVSQPGTHTIPMTGREQRSGQTCPWFSTAALVWNQGSLIAKSPNL